MKDSGWGYCPAMGTKADLPYIISHFSFVIVRSKSYKKLWASRLAHIESNDK